MKIKEYAFPAGVLSKLDDRILYIRFEKDLIDVDDVLEISRYRKRLIRAKAYGTVIDVRDERINMTNAAKECIANNPTINEFRKVEAIVVGSLTHKLMVTAYIKMFKPRSVSRAFLDVMTARDWVNMKLREFDTKETG